MSKVLAIGAIIALSGCTPLAGAIIGGVQGIHDAWPYTTDEDQHQDAINQQEWDLHNQGKPATVPQQ